MAVRLSPFKLYSGQARSLSFNHKCIKCHAVGESSLPFICRRYLPFVWFPWLFPVIYRSYINYHSRIKRFSLFNHKCTKRRVRWARHWNAPRYPFVLTRILSAMIAQYPRRINWSHLALVINLARVRRASGDVHAHASQRGAMLLSAFLLIAGCRQRYPPPRFWCGRTSKWRSLTERESLRFSIYWSVTNAREFLSGRPIGALVVVRDGIKLIHIFTVRSIQSHVFLSFHLNRNSLTDRSLFS